MTVRIIKENEFEQFFDLVCFAFNKQKTEPVKATLRKIFDKSHAYGVFDDKNELESTILSTPFAVNFHGTKLKMEGIGYVSSSEQARGKGNIAKLFDVAFKEMRMRGTVLSYLAPFSESFYRRFGYENAFYKYRGAINANEKNSASDITISESSFIDGFTSQVKDYFNSHQLSQHGGIVREDWWIDYQKEKHPNYYILTATSHAEIVGYLLYKKEEQDVTVLELFTDSEAISSNLLSNLQERDNHLIFDSASGLSSDNEKRPYMMARIIDLDYFLDLFPFKNDEADINFAIKDDFLPYNSGNYDIKITDEKRDILFRSLSMTDDYLTIQEVTPMLLGSEKSSLFNKITIETNPMLWDYF